MVRIDGRNVHWCVRNSVLYRDLELSTLVKFMKDASKRFFDIAKSHPNALLRSTASYEPSQPYHFIRRPRKILIHPPEALTAAVESFVERTHATRRLIRAGVPQGSTLSPLLYSAYTNDIPRPSSSGVQLALFADDTALFSGSRNRSTRFTLLPVQRAIDELSQWFRKWRIEVNPDKSAAIQFKYESTHF
ncbi:Probable RNA-directed DNA polymerase from transposon BS [Eumeta japonica]|uniref:Probable RNA-directed DNA polymerase from transposon BS n=1 Tax=Eumeta variegata TaxID=151549 RepID=A0A4C1WFL2_EUMVA|nr:Probable RNA-directed DNA polymerase from transposon BS [Eumeta japonica]